MVGDWGPNDGGSNSAVEGDWDPSDEIPILSGQGMNWDHDSDDGGQIQNDGGSIACD